MPTATWVAEPVLGPGPPPDDLAATAQANLQNAAAEASRTAAAIDEARDLAWLQGHAAGLEAGRQEHQTGSWDLGYQQGLAEGLRRGHVEGWADCADTTRQGAGGHRSAGTAMRGGRP